MRRRHRRQKESAGRAREAGSAETFVFLKARTEAHHGDRPLFPVKTKTILQKSKNGPGIESLIVNDVLAVQT